MNFLLRTFCALFGLVLGTRAADTPVLPRDATHTGLTGAELNASLVVAGPKGILYDPFRAHLSARGEKLASAH